MEHNNNENENSFSEIVKFALIAIVIVLPIRIFIAKPFIVSGSSMDPTFKDGQYLIVDQLTYRFESPKRGDVVIFKYPKNQTQYFIKRIIGLPGETVQAANGKVTIINKDYPQGFDLNENYIQNMSYDNFRDSLGAKEYFVMGDNRPASSDSRIWGHLPTELIVGRPLIRLFPIQKVSILPGMSEFNTNTKK